MIVRETVRRPQDAAFYFDPICPWTWITSRWLVEVAEVRGVEIDWKSMSLAQLNGGVENMPPQYQEAGRFSMSALRMMEAMRSPGDEDSIGGFYAELGTRLHVEQERVGVNLLVGSAESASVETYLDAADDDTWDIAVIDSTVTAMRLGGPDIGSPVLQIGEAERGFHGPIVSPAPHGDAALALWDSLVTLSRVPGFYELKHGREGAPVIEPVRDRAEVRRR